MLNPLLDDSLDTDSLREAFGFGERHFELPIDNSTAPDAESFPRQIATYTLLRLIGTGGMGAVYEALQEQLQRHVALKLIRSDRMSDDMRRRFSTEVQALGRLRHAGIARIYDGGTEETTSGSRPYFVMELVDGLRLDEYVSKHDVGIRECLTLMVRVAEAVHHAHQQGVIHRDLKPSNILVDETGQPKILDFGVARLVGTKRPSAAAATGTQAGDLVGTLAYMSPEQAERDPEHFDQRSDVYALGVITYKLLSGRLPYQLEGGTIDALSIIQETIPKRLGDIDERLRGDLETVVRRALKKERRDRYQTAQAFADDLRCVVNSRPISVVPTTLGAKIRRWTMQEENIQQAGGACVVIASLLGLFTFFYVCVGVIVWFWWVPIFPQDIRYREFMLIETFWTVFLALLAWVSWRFSQFHEPSMWFILISSALLLGFHVSVLLGYYSYDSGGALREPVVRTAFFMLFSLLAFLGVLSSLLAAGQRRIGDDNGPVRSSISRVPNNANRKKRRIRNIAHA